MSSAAYRSTSVFLKIGLKNEKYAIVFTIAIKEDWLSIRTQNQWRL